ncbi:hypothetical protein QBC47DRAFT_174694 [Echria macrotheca]|uniref:Uncharacterized protein n=1 Tax=Echria macrotheca TaxID=438768 RepID=A0AAJ0BFJ7_9PEZI|nr:hypothetical protein QBC47DRAFT_174694 [Echria macrotheca]
MPGGEKGTPSGQIFRNSSFPRVGGSDGGRDEDEGYSLNISNCPPDLPDSALLHGVFVFAHHHYGTKDARLGDSGPKGRSDSHPPLLYVICKSRLGDGHGGGQRYRIGILVSQPRSGNLSGFPTPPTHISRTDNRSETIQRCPRIMDSITNSVLTTASRIEPPGPPTDQQPNKPSPGRRSPPKRWSVPWRRWMKWWMKVHSFVLSWRGRWTTVSAPSPSSSGPNPAADDHWPALLQQSGPCADSDARRAASPINWDLPALIHTCMRTLVNGSPWSTFPIDYTASLQTRAVANDCHDDGQARGSRRRLRSLSAGCAAGRRLPRRDAMPVAHRLCTARATLTIDRRVRRIREAPWRRSPQSLCGYTPARTL